MEVLTIAVLMGGTSAEREVSLASGQMVMEGLQQKGHQAYPIEITADGFWQKTKKDVRASSIPGSVMEALNPIPDIVFIALHGPMGEDGTVQGLLETLSIPYTGSGVLASALGMDKHKSRLLFTGAGLLVPPYLMIEDDRNIAKTVQNAETLWGYPIVVKPNDSGSSLGVTINRDSQQLLDHIEQAFTFSKQVLLEPYLPGTEITAPLLGNMSPTALPVVEIVPPGEFFDYQCKYNGMTQEICPARIPSAQCNQAQQIAVTAFVLLGCSGFARADMMISHNQIYLLEINTIPGLTRESLVPKAANAAGLSFSDLLDQIVKLGLARWH
jgi:D-alanine-D-alanine ligase